MGNNPAAVEGDPQDGNLNNADRNRPPKDIVRFEVVAEGNSVLWKTFEIFNVHTHHENSQSSHEELAREADNDGPRYCHPLMIPETPAKSNKLVQLTDNEVPIDTEP